VNLSRIDLRHPTLKRMPASTPVASAEDDPVTLARLEAIMSDRIEGCQVCGADPHMCRAIGCDPGASGTSDRTEDRGPRLLVASLS
jgi:hypothetical protein